MCIRDRLKSDETAGAISRFVDRQIDDLLERRIDETVNDETLLKLVSFIEERFQRLVNDDEFENKVREFLSGRLDDLASSTATLADTFTPETVAFLKDRLDQQVPPIVHHLADIATSQNTRKQMGALIKKEVDEYYEQLSLFKKIFISRERIHREVDDLMNKTLPKRVEEYLRGPAFEQEAEAFLNSTIDNVMARPLDELVGQIDLIKFQELQEKIAIRLIEILRSEVLF